MTLSLSLSISPQGRCVLRLPVMPKSPGAVRPTVGKLISLRFEGWRPRLVPTPGARILRKRLIKQIKRTTFQNRTRQGSRKNLQSACSMRLENLQGLGMRIREICGAPDLKHDATNISDLRNFDDAFAEYARILKCQVQIPTISADDISTDASLWMSRYSTANSSSGTQIIIAST